MSHPTGPAGFGEAGLEEESGQLHPLSNIQEAEDGLQDTKEKRVFRGVLRWPIWPAHLCACPSAARWLAGLAFSASRLRAAGSIGCPVPSKCSGTAQCRLLQEAWEIRQQGNG